MYSGKTFWQTVGKWRWLYIGLAAVLYTIRLGVFDIQLPGFFVAIESNCWIFAVFGFGYTYLNKTSRLLSYLSKAAYPIYIIHMFVLYLGAKLILPLGIPPMAQFIGITLFTAIGCYLIYELIIKRVGFLRPLFGLKWKFNKKISRKTGRALE